MGAIAQISRQHLTPLLPARLQAELSVVAQLWRYALVSVLALALDFTVYLVLTALGLSLPLAGVIGYTAGMGLHYLLSTRFVFDARATDKAHARLFGEFALSGIAGMSITALVIALATGIGDLAPLSAKVLAAGASFLVVFTLRRTVVFARGGTGGGSVAPGRGLEAKPSPATDKPMPVPQSGVESLRAELSRTAPAMHAAWALTLGLSLAVLVLAALTGVTIAWDEFWSLPALAAAVGALGVLLRVHGRWRRLGDVAEVAAVLGLLAVFVPLLTCILARTGLPLADRQLIAWDAALGVDWLRLVTLLKAQETLSLVLSHAYASLMQQPTVLLVVLGLAGLTHRLQQFALAWTLALVATALVFPLAPALGGYLHYGFAPADFPFIRVRAAWLHATVLEPLRNGTMTELGRLALEGIVTFPSFHTSAAVLLAWAFWGVRLVRWPALAVNAVMIVSCPVVGAHYIVDVLAGGALAWGAIIVARRFGAPDRSHAELVWIAR